MAGPSGRENPPLIDRLFKEPTRFRFFQAVRLLERDAARRAGGRGGPKVGEESDPRLEPARFRSHVALGYAASEVVEAKPGAIPELTVGFMGLAGSSGVLPFHYTATLIRSLRTKSLALRDFL